MFSEVTTNRVTCNDGTEQHFSCTICGFKSKHNAQVAMNKHVDEKKHGLLDICCLCETNLQSKVKIEKPLDEEHSALTVDDSVCEALPLPALLKWGKTDKKKESRNCGESKKAFNPFSCQACSYRGKTLGSIDDHIKAQHGAIKVACGHCTDPPRFSTVGGLYYDHHMDCHGDKPLTYNYVGFLKQKNKLTSSKQNGDMRCTVGDYTDHSSSTDSDYKSKNGNEYDELEEDTNVSSDGSVNYDSGYDNSVLADETCTSHTPVFPKRRPIYKLPTSASVNTKQTANQDIALEKSKGNMIAPTPDVINKQHSEEMRSAHNTFTDTCNIDSSSPEFHTVLSPYREIEQYGTHVTSSLEQTSDRTHLDFLQLKTRKRLRDDDHPISNSNKMIKLDCKEQKQIMLSPMKRLNISSSQNWNITGDHVTENHYALTTANETASATVHGENHSQIEISEVREENIDLIAAQNEETTAAIGHEKSNFKVSVTTETMTYVIEDNQKTTGDVSNESQFDISSDKEAVIMDGDDGNEGDIDGHHTGDTATHENQTVKQSYFEEIIAGVNHENECDVVACNKDSNVAVKHETPWAIQSHSGDITAGSSLDNQHVELTHTGEEEIAAAECDIATEHRQITDSGNQRDIASSNDRMQPGATYDNERDEAALKEITDSDCPESRDKTTKPTSPKKYRCPYCLSYYNSNSGFQYHVGTHFNYTPFQCKECGKSFKLHPTAENHHRHNHPKKRPQVIYVADTEVDKYIKLAVTWSANDANTPTMKLRCLKCDFQAHTIAIMKKHLKALHESECGTGWSEQYTEIESDSQAVHKIMPSNKTSSSTPALRCNKGAVRKKGTSLKDLKSRQNLMGRKGQGNMDMLSKPAPYKMPKIYHKINKHSYFTCEECQYRTKNYAVAEKHFQENHAACKESIKEKEPSTSHQDENGTSSPTCKGDTVHLKATKKPSTSHQDENDTSSPTCKGDTVHLKATKKPSTSHQDENGTSSPKGDTESVSHAVPKKIMDRKKRIANFVHNMKCKQKVKFRNKELQAELAAYKMTKVYDKKRHYSFFTCTECEHRTMDFAVAQTHFLENHAPSNISIQNSAELKVKKSTKKSAKKSPETTLVNSFSCVLCKISWKTINLLQKHVQKEHRNLSVRCNLCSIEKPSAKELFSTHFKFAHFSSPFQYSYVRYEEGHFSRKQDTPSTKQKQDSLSMSVISKEMTTACKFCQKEFKRKSMGRLADHLARYHVKYAPYKCPKCGLKHYFNADLQAHIRRTHKIKHLKVLPIYNPKKQAYINELMKEHFPTIVNHTKDRQSIPSPVRDAQSESNNSGESMGTTVKCEPAEEICGEPAKSSCSDEGCGLKSEKESLVAEYNTCNLTCPYCSFTHIYTFGIKQHIKRIHPVEFAQNSNVSLNASQENNGSNGCDESSTPTAVGASVGHWSTEDTEEYQPQEPSSFSRIERTIAIKCPLCIFPSDSEENILAHVMKVHVERVDVQCINSGSVSHNQSDGSVSDSNSVRADNALYKCALCMFTSSYNDLTSHLNVAHSFVKETSLIEKSISDTGVVLTSLQNGQVSLPSDRSSLKNSYVLLTDLMRMEHDEFSELLRSHEVRTLDLSLLANNEVLSVMNSYSDEDIDVEYKANTSEDECLPDKQLDKSPNTIKWKFTQEADGDADATDDLCVVACCDSLFELEDCLSHFTFVDDSVENDYFMNSYNGARDNNDEYVDAASGISGEATEAQKMKAHFAEIAPFITS